MRSRRLLARHLGRLFRQRQGDDEQRAPGRNSFGSYLAAVRVRDRPTDRESQTDTASAACIGASSRRDFAALKLVEQTIGIEIGREARAVINDRELDLIAMMFGTDRHMRAGRGMPRGVFEQIREQLCQQHRIGLDQR